MFHSLYLFRILVPTLLLFFPSNHLQTCTSILELFKTQISVCEMLTFNCNFQFSFVVAVRNFVNQHRSNWFDMQTANNRKTNNNLLSLHRFDPGTEKIRWRRKNKKKKKNLCFIYMRHIRVCYKFNFENTKKKQNSSCVKKWEISVEQTSLFFLSHK